MSDEPRSLILIEESRRPDDPSLFPEFEDALRLEEENLKGEFTGERLFERDPRRYQFIVHLLAQGMSEAAIARVCQVSRNTINGVREREQIPIEQEKGKILKDIRTGLRMSIERLIELIPEMGPRDAAIALGILAEKHQLLSGEATHIVGTAGDKAQHASYNDMLAAIEKEANARVVGTGSSGEMAGQKGDGLGGSMGELAAADRAADGLDAGVIEGHTDKKSVVSQSKCGAGNAEGNTTSAHEQVAGERERVLGADEVRASGLEHEGSNQGGRGSASGEGAKNPN